LILAFVGSNLVTAVVFLLIGRAIGRRRDEKTRAEFERFGYIVLAEMKPQNAA
jgi:hypothetical protein